MGLSQMTDWLTHILTHGLWGGEDFSKIVWKKHSPPSNLCKIICDPAPPIPVKKMYDPFIKLPTHFDINRRNCYGTLILIKYQRLKNGVAKTVKKLMAPLKSYWKNWRPSLKSLWQKFKPPPPLKSPTHLLQ